MRKIKKRGKKSSSTRYVYGSAVFTFLGLVIILVISAPLMESIEQKNEIEEEIQSIKQEIESLESENQDLENLIKYLKSDQFLEEQARLNFGMKKQGESVVVVTDEGKVAGVSTSSIGQTDNDISGSEMSNPQKWFSYFFGN